MFRKMFTRLAVLPLLVTMPAMAYEEASHTVVESNDVFEVREYAPMITAEVVVDESEGESNNSAFRILFNYISGNNISQEEIAMTTPVITQDTEGESIAMTTPVIESGNKGESDSYRFSFVMPASFTMDTIPMPKDERVQIVEVPAKRIAVRRYSGSWSEKNAEKNEAILLEALRESGIEVIGEPMVARYNSPFTLWFMRRNEVMVEIAG